IASYRPKWSSEYGFPHLPGRATTTASRPFAACESFASENPRLRESCSRIGGVMMELRLKRRAESATIIFPHCLPCPALERLTQGVGVSPQCSMSLSPLADVLLSWRLFR